LLMSAGTCSYALPCALDGLQPVLLDFASSSSCLFLQLLRRHGGTALFEFMAEQLCSRQILSPPLKNDPNTTKVVEWWHLMVQINPPLGTHRLPMKSKITGSTCKGDSFFSPFVNEGHCVYLPHPLQLNPRTISLLQTELGV